MTSNPARDILWPTDPRILVRVAMLHVGQGSCAVVLAAENGSYRSLLVDINLDAECGGTDVPALVRDLVGNGGLGVFVNTHPHDDHLCGVTELSEAVSIGEVWHSGHVPSKKYGACYEQLEVVKRKVVAAGGQEIILQGSREEKRLGDARYHVLAPAEYVTEEVNEDQADIRYRRIHEQCVVLKFGIAPSWVMIAGDADRDAFEKYITRYHRDRLGASALAASHHGSRTFFRYDEADEPYRAGLTAIDPEHIIVSAPRRDESAHGHPHSDAMGFYADHVGAGNVRHTGQDRHCFICDIYRDGSYGGVGDDQGVLAANYPILKEDGGPSRPKGGFTERVAPTSIGPGRYAVERWA